MRLVHPTLAVARTLTPSPLIPPPAVEHSRESWNFEAHVVDNGFWIVLALSFVVSVTLMASYGCIQRALGFKTRTDKQLMRPGLF